MNNDLDNGLGYDYLSNAITRLLGQIEPTLPTGLIFKPVTFYF